MSLSVGIVGLANVGKSTLFNALVKESQAEVSNYPFCTIEPNVGIVEVPDTHLDELQKILQTSKKIPAPIKFIDIAGLVKGAHKGEGLGNKFLANIREVDAILLVLRGFKDQKITSTQNEINPEKEFETIKIELILKDLETIEKRIKTEKRELKTGNKIVQETIKTELRTQISELKSSLQLTDSKITNLQSDLQSSNSQIKNLERAHTDLQSALESANKMNNLAIGIGVVAVIIAIISVFLRQKIASPTL